MLLNPAILALLVVSLISSAMVLLAAGFALSVLRNWDIDSGHQLQLTLERRTYLISTLLVFSFTAQLLSLLLFVMTGESLSSQFVGAMCATGVLNVNGYGWPLLFNKIAVFFSAAVWLSLNHLDNRASTYPLIRIKYLLLLAMVPLLLLETGLSFLYFLNMNPDVITSCCGALFSADAQGVAAEVSGLKPWTALAALAASGATLFTTAGLYFLLHGRGGVLYGMITGLTFCIALTAIVSVISLYVYEHPHHHCPFCILKSGHDFIGYLLYIPLFLAAAAGLSAAAVAPAARINSLQSLAPAMAGRLILLSAVFYAFFFILVIVIITRSNLTMQGVWW